MLASYDSLQAVGLYAAAECTLKFSIATPQPSQKFELHQSALHNIRIAYISVFILDIVIFIVKSIQNLMINIWTLTSILIAAKLTCDRR